MDRYTELYIHCVWATWDRLPLIAPDFEAELYASLAAKCQQFGCHALAIGGINNHVHTVVQLTPTVPISRIIGEMKGTSSHFVNHCLQPQGFFKWQGGYSVFTVGKRSLPSVCAYVYNQKVHHQQGTIVNDFEL